MSQIMTLDLMKNLSADQIARLYWLGYRIEGLAIDPVVNFGKVAVSIGYNSSATSIILNTGDGARLPNPSIDGQFNLVWWNSTDYSDPSDDPDKEIVRVTAKTGDTLTILRAQEGTSSSNKNISAKIYKMILSPTAKVISDVQTTITDSIETHRSTGIHALKQPTDTSFFRSFWQKQGIIVQGTWAWNTDPGQTNYATVTGEPAGFYRNTATHADNDEYKWSDVYLTPGNYKITIYTYIDPGSAITEILFGTTSLGTKDCYNPTTSYNQLFTLTFTITSSTTADLRFKATGKNANSANYYIGFSRFELEKIG